MKDIQTLMQLVEGGMDKYFYSHNSGFEIMFGKGFNWRYRVVNEGEWLSFTKTDVITKLESTEISLETFHNSLTQRLIDQVVYCEMRIRQIEDAVGAKAVQHGRESWAAFGEGLRLMITKEIGKTNLTLVKE